MRRPSLMAAWSLNFNGVMRPILGVPIEVALSAAPDDAVAAARTQASTRAAPAVATRAPAIVRACVTYDAVAALR